MEKLNSLDSITEALKDVFVKSYFSIYKGDMFALLIREDNRCLQIVAGEKIILAEVGETPVDSMFVESESKDVVFTKAMVSSHILEMLK